MCTLCIVCYSFCGVLLCEYGFFFFKQKTAYDMRISDWSSDVCSSDLNICLKTYPTREYLGLIFGFFGDGEPPKMWELPELEDEGRGQLQIGRASCRERVCQYV